MKKFLQGERVYLRPFEKEDYQLIHKALMNPEIRKMTGNQQYLSLPSIEKAYDNFALDRNRIDLVIALQETNEPIGDLSLLSVDHLNRNASVRIALHEDQYFGKGYGTEALSLILSHGFNTLNLYRIGLNVYDYNARGQKSYEKLGFKKEGVIRGEIFYDGKYHDNILMGVLAEEFFVASTMKG